MLHTTGIPIYIIGAGGIVNHAHLPAYTKAGFNVAGIFDKDKTKSDATAKAFNVPKVFDGLQEMIDAAGSSSIFDIAVPATELMDILNALPTHANVLMQKPMGMNLDDAKEILDTCRQKHLNAAVNFQLRYAPFIRAARELFATGKLGELCEVDLNINVETPWNNWKFLYDSPRVEILYHSIHYIDLVRNLLGEPEGIYAKTVKHPLMKELASVRSNIIMDYGDMVRANIITNHCHRFGPQNQHSTIRLEGTKGAVKISMGVLMNYPHGQDDEFEYIILEEGKQAEWIKLPIMGTWLPDAFTGSMQQVLDTASGIIAAPDNSVEDCIHTMRCVEAAYLSSAKGSVLLRDIQ